MKTQTVYKVVLGDSNKIVFSSITHHHLSVDYSLNIATYPRVGKLFVFDTLDSAKRFKHLNETILKGIATNTYKPKFLCSAIDISKFWERYNLARKHHKALTEYFDSIDLSTPIHGTLFCNSFTPTEIIKD